MLPGRPCTIPHSRATVPHGSSPLSTCSAAGPAPAWGWWRSGRCRGRWSRRWSRCLGRRSPCTPPASPASPPWWCAPCRSHTDWGQSPSPPRASAAPCWRFGGPAPSARWWCKWPLPPLPPRSPGSSSVREGDSDSNVRYHTTNRLGSNTELFWIQILFYTLLSLSDVSEPTKLSNSTNPTFSWSSWLAQLHQTRSSSTKKYFNPKQLQIWPLIVHSYDLSYFSSPKHTHDVVTEVQQCILM